MRIASSAAVSLVADTVAPRRGSSSTGPLLEDEKLRNDPRLENVTDEDEEDEEENDETKRDAFVPEVELKKFDARSSRIRMA